MSTTSSADLAQSVEKALKLLSQTYDDIGITSHEKEQRSANVYKSLQDCLREQVNSTNKEKEQLVEECTSLIQSIRQMEKSMEDYADDQSLRITLPLIQCRRDLREKMKATNKRHQQKFEEVMELTKELRRFADALEPSFLKLELPPSDHSKATNFNLSSSYTNALHQEFSRVEQEFFRRCRKVTEMGGEIVKLWAELGSHTLQTDRKIMQCYKDAPEQIGLKMEDMRSLTQKLRGLREEKEAREQKIAELSEVILPLWEKLNINEDYRHQFLATHRSVSHKTILEIEQECERLQQLKRDNLHIFVEDARQTLQRLWDELYFSEDEMLEFTPAFTDDYTDALLQVHETEIAHLEELLEERQPILVLVDKHKSLMNDKEQLAISSTDASRLMSRGGTGVARDPTRLLREERMRKRIAKDLPRVEAELRAALEEWEEEYGKPFTVKGEDYLETLLANCTTRSRLNSKSSGTMAPPPPRTPSTPGIPQTRTARSQSVKESKSAVKLPALKHSVSSASQVPSNSTSVQRSNATLRPKTPTSATANNSSSQPKRPTTSHSNRPKTPTSSTIRGPPAYATVSKTPNRNSRPALTQLTHEPNSPERGASIGTTASNTSNHGSLSSYKSVGSIRRKLPPPPVNAAAAKSGKRSTTPSQTSQTQPMRRNTNSRQGRSREGSVEHSIRAITPPVDSAGTPRTFHNGAYLRNAASLYRQEDDSPGAESSGSRQSPKSLHPRAFSATSNDSSATAVSSENWETYDSEGEDDTHMKTMYYHKLRNSGQGAKSPPMEYAYRNFAGIHNQRSPRSPHSSIAIVGDDEWDE